MLLPIRFAFLFCLLFSCSARCVLSQELKPYVKNQAYWQYKGKPVLLLGATDNDNLFQNDHVQSHLDSLRAAGGNYIRNTMSDRDPGNTRAYLKNSDGKYDLNKWNDDYWKRFENLLRLARSRDIIVQIEVWDRFDHSRNEWTTDPYNPENNINYSYDESSLDSVYPLHPGANKQPFFFSVPALEDNKVLLPFQQAFVKKLLSVSLSYDNVLYCIDNETSGVEEWAIYWADFIRENAKGKKVYITEMWDKWDVKDDMHKRTLDHPGRYDYIDISQNSQVAGPENWENQQYVFRYISGRPRPVNSTKIYGSDQGPWLDRGITRSHAIETFFRNIVGGFASSRFHRPPSGLGLSEPSIQSIRTVRKIEEIVKLWDISPRMDLLSDVEENEAYVAAKEGEKYVVYFPKDGRVKLDLSGPSKRYRLKWISIKDSSWGKVRNIQGGDAITLEATEAGGSLAVLY